MELRNNVLIDASYYEDMQSLTDDEQGKLYKALIDYGFTRKEPENLNGSLLTIFKVLARRIEGAQNKYDASIRNGKLGGRPKKITKTTKNENPRKTSDKTSNRTSTKTSDINQCKNQWENQTETEKENVSFPSVNKNNIFYLPTTEGVRAKEYPDIQRKCYLSPSYEYHEQDKYGEMFLLISDTLLEIQEYATVQGQIKFNGNVYTAEQVNKRLTKNGKKLVDGLAHKLIHDKTIKNKPLYILGSLLSGN